METHHLNGRIARVAPKVTPPRRDRFPHRSYRSPRRHFRNGTRAAATRAVTAAELLADGKLPSARVAAVACGTCPQYVGAARVLLQSESHELLARVLSGQVPLLAAARRVKTLSALVEAYRKADPATRIEFGRQIGVADLWDGSIVPAL